MKKREMTRPVQVGSYQLGGQNKVLIQSMTNTKTHDVQATVNQILALEKAGCEIVRMAVLDEADALAIKEIKPQVHVPLVADIHFNHRLALIALDGGIKYPISGQTVIHRFTCKLRYQITLPK